MPHPSESWNVKRVTVMFNPNNIEGIIWDLDNTLYRFTDNFRRHCNEVAAQLAVQMGLPMSEAEAFDLAEKSESRYGYSIHYFVKDYGCSYRDMHGPFHDLVGVEHIEMIEGMREKLTALPHPQAILTNASKGWARRALTHAGLKDLFPDDKIIAVEDADFEAKSISDKGFKLAVETLNLCPTKIMMVDDMTRNLKIPHEMGMQTAHVHYDKKNNITEPHVHTQFETAIDCAQSLNT